MARVFKLFLSALLALALLFAAAAGALAWWLSGDGPRLRLQALATEQLGVSVSLGAMSLSVLPWPSVAVSDVKIATQAPLSAQRVALRPAWRKLLGLGGAAREVELESLSLEGLNLPQRGLDQLSKSLLKTERSAQNTRRQSAKSTQKTEDGKEETAAVIVGLLAIPKHTQLENVVWQSAAGEALSLSGELSLNAAREQMDVDLRLAGGSVRGVMRLVSQGGKSGWQLRGELVTRGVDLAQLPGARQRMAGRLSGTTTIDARAAKLTDIDGALQTSTPFNVSGAVIKGMDLAKAVRTLGLSRGGETALQQLSGTLSTRGSGAPMQITLSDLQASSSLLKASGAVSVGAAASPGAPRALNGKVSVDLMAGSSQVGQAVGQLVGIPLEISGTTAAPVVAPTRGAMIGGALGSVMAPVIGTGAGAKMGDKVGEKLSDLKEKLFGK
ncbi:AsmA family protein [Variovorax sp. PCZ-1]|uniref:AsmA family protein n=1 Tax=Variovorax sp. PCZ-1 TaxID=2835533 RepID=UPI001BCFC738|nr:AsmA family protein [Variovorax sp. PCZ-1]MBS7808721.1 hypothetical protein [Variovorax sp. PCZ-1]